MSKNFHYFIYKAGGIPIWSLSDLEFCAESERTIDVPFNDFALQAHALKLPGMFYFEGRKGISIDRYTKSERIENQIGYLAAFFHSDGEEVRQNLAANPTLRLLICDNELLTRVKEILK